MSFYGQLLFVFVGTNVSYIKNPAFCQDMYFVFCLNLAISGYYFPIQHWPMNRCVLRVVRTEFYISLGQCCASFLNFGQFRQESLDEMPQNVIKRQY